MDGNDRDTTNDGSNGKRKFDNLYAEELSTNDSQNKKPPPLFEYASPCVSEVNTAQTGESTADEEIGDKLSNGDSHSKSGTEQNGEAGVSRDISSSPGATATSEVEDEESKEKRDERRMEINRQRAKEIRKRKKKMVEDMQKQIIYLTLENNKLRTQTQMQLTEINLLRQAAMPKSMMGNAQQQIDLLTQQQGGQQQGFNSNEMQETNSNHRGVQNSLLNRLNHSMHPPSRSNVLGGGENPLSALSTAHGILGSSSHTLSSHVDHNQGAGFPFSNVSSSVLGGLSASKVANALRGSSSASAPASNLNLLGTNGASNATGTTLANMLALQQQEKMNESLGLVGNLPLSRGAQESSTLSATAQQDEIKLNQQQQQLSNLLANASPEIKSSLLQRLQADEQSDVRILSMILEQQQHFNDGTNGSNNIR